MRETWWLAPDGADVLDQHGLPLSVAAMMEASRAGEVLSSDRQSAAVLLVLGERALLLKWRAPRPGRRWRTFLRPSRERKETRALLGADARGIVVPSSVAVGERRRGGRLVGSVLVRRFLSHHVPANVVLPDDADGALQARLATALAQWHHVGFRHGDAYPKNVLVPPDDGSVVPIGAPAARWRKPGCGVDRHRLKDLAQWAAGCRDLNGDAAAFRFLPAYARAAGLGVDAEALARLEARVRIPYDRILVRKAERIATRHLREAGGHPAPTPLPPDPPEIRGGRGIRRRLRPWAGLAGPRRPG